MKKFLAGILMLASVTAFAEEVQQPKMDMSMVPVGIINSSNGVVFRPGVMGIVLQHESVKMDELYKGTDEATLTLSPGQSQTKEVILNRTNTTLRYGIGKGFDIRAIIPYVDKEVKVGARTQQGLIEKDFDSSGLGDIQLVSRYQILNQLKGDSMFMTAGAGVKFATGESEEKKNGAFMPMAVQNGSGSTDYLAEFGVTKLLGRHRIDGYAAYMFNTEGSQDFKFGDVAKYDIGYSFSVTKFFDLEIELNGKTQAKNEQYGHKIASSGSTTYSVTPGFHIRRGQNLHFSVGVPYTIYRDVNGTQPTADMSIMTRLSFQH